MEAIERKVVLLLCAVVYLSCVVNANFTYYLDTDRSFIKDTAIIQLGSDVTLECKDRWNTSRVAWYRSPAGVAIADMDYSSGKCELRKYGSYPLISTGTLGCTVGRLYITISSIQYRHEGGWFCTAGGRTSNTLNITLSGMSLSSPTISTATQITTTKTTLEPTSLPKTEAVSIKETETAMVVTEDMKTRDKMIPLIAGIVSGIVALIVIVTMVIVLITKRRNFQQSWKRTHYHDSVRQSDSDNDELVMADNSLYVQYNYEENNEKRLEETTNSYDTVRDVYSVVENTVKSEATVSDVYSAVQNTATSEAI